MRRPGHISFTGRQTVDVDDREYDVEYSVSANMSYAPARISGPPENCHPDESECELLNSKILSITTEEGGEVPTTRSPELWSKCLAALNEAQIEEKAWEVYFEG